MDANLKREIMLDNYQNPANRGRPVDENYISVNSIMTKELIGKSLDDVKKIIENFYNMIEEREYEKELFSEAIVFDEIYKQANRKTCATLPYKGILDAIKIYENNKKA